MRRPGIKPSQFMAISVLIMVAYLTGCNTGRAKYDPKTEWLNKSLCSAPCWENIQPGTTSAKQALEYVKTNRLVDPGSLSRADEMGVTTISWKFTGNTSWDGKLVFYTEKPTDVLESLVFHTPDLCLHEIIDSYGEPDFLFEALFRIDKTVDLIWRNFGIFYSAKLSGSGKRIDGNVCGGGIVLFEPGLPLTEVPGINLYYPREDQFAPWKGYGDY